MPDWVHGLTGAWLTREMGFMLKENFLTEAEFESVLMAGNAKSSRLPILCRLSRCTLTEKLSAFSRFAAPYEHSQKMADFYILPWANHLPSVVVEGAWSEDMDKFLNDDRLIWLVGGRPDINKLILCRFKKEGGRKVSGRAELWGLDTKGNQVMLQQEVRKETSRPKGGFNSHAEANNDLIQVIWPIPDSASAASAQYIPLTRADVLGQSLPQDRPPNDVYRLSIDSLRSVSQRCMNRAG
jgi:hypothetical protein